MGRGVITLIEDAESKKKGLDLILRKYGAGIDLTYVAEDLDAMVLLTLRVETVTGKQGGRW